MIVTDRFVFLHLHKSGGTFVNRFLAAFFPEAHQVGYHLPRACLPEAMRDRPLLGSVRNPWDYYVSWYSFQAAKPQPNALFDVVSEGGRLGFAQTVRNLVQLGDDGDRLRTLASRLPEDFPNRGINLTRACVAPLAGSGLGFYSFLYRRMYGEAADVRMLRMERLRADLIEALPGLGIGVTAAMRDWIANSERANTSRHDHYAGYYNGSLMALVAERDAAVIRGHAYRFEPALAG